MFFKKKNKIESHAKKLDKLVTWLIIGWAVASMIGLSKTKAWKEITTNIKLNSTWILKKWYSIFWKTLVWIIRFFNKK